jgi:hypothetical protein
MQIACGIAQKRYAFPNVSQKTYTTVKYAVKTMSSLADVIIFLFLGVVTISHKHEWHTGFALWTLGLCTVARYPEVSNVAALEIQRSPSIFKNVKKAFQIIRATFLTLWDILMLQA